MNRMFATADRRKVAAGAIFLAIGGFFAIMAQRFDVGTLARLGPGGFPMLLGGVLAALGLATMVTGVLAGQTPAPFVWRDVARNKAVFLVPLAVVAFALVIEEAGLVVAIIATVIVGCLANARVRPLEAALLALALAAGSALLFVYGLGLPFSLWPPH